ncbi:MAG: hypothetical protein ABW184_13570 [Sphingobium sp.]
MADKRNDTGSEERIPGRRDDSRIPPNALVVSESCHGGQYRIRALGHTNVAADINGTKNTWDIDVGQPPSPEPERKAARKFFGGFSFGKGDHLKN